MNQPTNTSKVPAFVHLAEARRNPSRFIEDMEAQGQRELVRSEVLPVDFGYSKGSKEALEAVGFQFLGEVPNDPIFQRVKFPEGWTRKGTDHSMWSNVLDEQGRERIRIFYKAAFYDRSAHASVLHRFRFNTEYTQKEPKYRMRWLVLDGEAVLFTTDDADAYSRESDQHRDEAKAWLTEHYPDWENAAAYWELPQQVSA